MYAITVLLLLQGNNKICSGRLFRGDGWADIEGRWAVKKKDMKLGTPQLYTHSLGGYVKAVVT